MNYFEAIICACVCLEREGEWVELHSNEYEWPIKARYVLTSFDKRANHDAAFNQQRC